VVSEYPGQVGEGLERAAPAADYLFLNIISGHPGQGGEGEGGGAGGGRIFPIAFDILLIKKCRIL